MLPQRLNFKIVVTFLSILLTRVSSRCPNGLSVEDNNEITENGKFHLKSQDSQYLTGTHFKSVNLIYLFQILTKA